MTWPYLVNLLKSFIMISHCLKWDIEVNALKTKIVVTVCFEKEKKHGENGIDVEIVDIFRCLL